MKIRNLILRNLEKESCFLKQAADILLLTYKNWRGKNSRCVINLFVHKSE